MKSPALPLTTPKFLAANSSTTVEMREENVVLPGVANDQPLPMWVYREAGAAAGGGFLGPCFEVASGEPVEIVWSNRLFREPHPGHIMPAEYPALVDSPPTHNHPVVPYCIAHLHGAVVPPQSDGWPDNKFGPGDSMIFRYPNCQRAALLWYHDHGMHYTAKTVYAGLAGLYVIRDAEEQSLNLPRGDRELLLVACDRSVAIDSAGAPRIAYATSADQPEFFGDAILINGALTPGAAVAPGLYRLRFLNACNSRSLRLRFSDPSVPVKLIGTDGLLDQPFELPAAGLVLAPAERADLLVDFATAGGKMITLTSDAAAPFPGDGTAVKPVPLLTFAVQAGASAPAIFPATLSAGALPPDDALQLVVATRVFFIFENEDKLVFLSTVEPILPPPDAMQRARQEQGFDAGTAARVALDSWEIWNFDNRSGDTHPIHIHLVNFTVLERVPNGTGEPIPNGCATHDYERRWKDTVQCHPGEITRLLVRIAGHTGQYLFHCHMLEHEDHDMMRAFIVGPPSAHLHAASAT